MDLELLRSLVALSEKGHVGDAADERGVSQPAMTKRIRRLERIAGVDLVAPNGRGSVLTPAGAVLADRSRVILGFVDAALREASDVAGQVRGPLLGLPGFSESIESILLFEEPRVAAFHLGHRFANASSLTLDDLATERILACAPNRDHWIVNPRPDGSCPPLGPLVSNVDEMLQVVASGQAMTFTGESVGSFYTRNDISYVPVIDIEPSSIFACWMAGRVSSRVEAVLDVIRERSGDS